MTFTKLKFYAILICDLVIPKTSQAKKENLEIARHDLPTKFMGSQFLLVSWTTIKTIVPHLPKWIGLHHHLIQFAFKKSSSLIIVGFVDALMGFKGKT
jgi:hypothetical protein